MDIRLFNVVSSSPSPNAEDVALNSEVRISFNIDVNRQTISGGISVQERVGSVPINGVIIYDNNRTISFKPSIQLKTGIVYDVYVKSSIKSVLDVPCNAFNFSFKTKVDELIDGPVLISPNNLSLLVYEEGVDIDEQVVKVVDSVNNTDEEVNGSEFQDLSSLITRLHYVRFSWHSSKNANGYAIEVSESETFNVLTWSTAILVPQEAGSTRIIKELSSEPLKPNTLYYWRVKAYTSIVSPDSSQKNPNDAAYGEWSETRRFTILKELNPVITIDDGSNIDPFVELNQAEVNILDIFPETNFSNTGTNIKTFYIVLDGLINNPRGLDPRKWIVAGRHITEDVNLDTYDVTIGKTNTTYRNSIINSITEEYNHGMVDGTWSIILDEDNNKTIVVFHPAIL